MANQQAKAAAQPATAIQSPLDKALIKCGEDLFKRDSKNRFAEDMEWYQAALFYQLKQWIKKQDNRWQQIPQDPKKPFPMPVSDYFSKTINANANTLGAAIPQMVASPNDQNSVTRRAAEAAESAFDEMDKESGMDVQNPKLAKHTVLWGMGCTKETVDTSEAAGSDQVPNVSLSQLSVYLCPNCGYMAPAGSQDGPQPQGAGINPAMPNPQASGEPSANTYTSGASVNSPTCPECGSQMQTEQLSDVEGADMQQFPTGKLYTEVIPILEIYLPRDCRDPNLSPRVIHRFRKQQTVAKRLYPNAGDLPLDEKRDINQFYMDSLRGLVMGVSDSDKLVSFTEIWANWDQLDDDTQEAISAEWQSEPSNIIGYEGKSRLQAAQQYGIYWIYAGNKLLCKSENPWDGRKCFTFYPWEKDPASPYPKGLSVPLIPKQRQLNRLDCLMELSEQTLGTGKLMADTRQMSNFKPTGNPVDVYWYDGQDGKTPPTFIMPQPYGAALPAKRAAIIEDFRELGYTQGVQTGDSPGGGVNSFRGIAYLGAKAEENIQTQRFLWEQGHLLRKELLLIMARKIWDVPRKAKIAGFNGKFGMAELTRDSLMGDFGLDVKKGSSRPKTTEEKLSSFQIAVQGGLVDMSDSQTRDYALDELGIDEVNPADHYNYAKADRDLEKLKQGIMPAESPFQKWDIFLKLFAQYTLTEEFEALDPAIQHGILMYAQYCSDKLTAVTQGTPPDPAMMNAKMAAAIHGGKPGDPLSGIPGETGPPSQAEMGAQNQGAALAQRMGASA